MLRAAAVARHQTTALRPADAARHGAAWPIVAVAAAWGGGCPAALCLRLSARCFATAAASSHSSRLARIRNLGIIAHIDAGKTTTAERLLFYSRRTRVLGDVDRGDTVLDFMREERERGITIQAACITLPWTRVGPHADADEHRLNLIDTPGHVDFTAQVEQSLRVLDGAVCVLDGVKGVEAQTVCVWQQAAKYGVARIAFVNKMDRDGASFTRVVDTIRDKLHTQPLVITLPLFSKDSADGGDRMRPAFVGLIDLLRMETWEWGTSAAGTVTAGNLSGQADDGSKFTVRPISPKHEDYAEAVRARGDLLEKLSDADDRIMELCMDAMGEETDAEPGHLKIPAPEIVSALRRITTTLPPTAIATPSTAASSSSSSALATVADAIPVQPYTLVMCGSSKANKGVQFLLNAILDYLPSPLDKQHVQIEEMAPRPHGTPSKKTTAAAATAVHTTTPALRKVGGDPSKEPLLALAFKVSHDLARGAMPIVFVRVYTGALRKGDTIVSVSPSSAQTGPIDLGALAKERPQKLLEISADNLTMELAGLEAGNIGALVGLKATRTGDTILGAAAATNPRERSGFMRGIAFSEPVFFCSVEAGSLSAARALDQALVCLQREDPSLSVSTDADSGQTVLAGMGELHLDIIRSRLERDFSLGAEEGGGGIEFGAMRISYREGLAASETATFTHAPTGPTSDVIEATLTAKLEPTAEVGTGVTVEVELPGNLTAASPSAAGLLAAAQAGAKDGLARGPLLGYPLTDVTVTISGITFAGPATQAAAQSVRACAARAVATALRQARASSSAHLLEPVMACELTLSPAHLGDVLSDLTSKRRGSILDVRQLVEGPATRSQVEAEVPLACMLGYANVLRSTTQGGGSFVMQFKQFRPTPPHVQTQLLESPP